MVETFSPWTALAGGALLGLAATLLLALLGRIAGISGIVGGLVVPPSARAEVVWRALFVAGLLVGGLVALFAMPSTMTLDGGPGITVAVIAGLLVGVGTRLGSGCTSGHGVCGISRLSPRSIVATMTFMGAGAAMAFAVRALGVVR